MTKTATTKTTVAPTKTTKTTKPLSKSALNAKRIQSKKNRKAGGKKAAIANKKLGTGIFAPKTLSKDLAAICGSAKLPRTEVTKKIWAYIKAKKLNDGRIVKPDDKLKAVFPVAKLDMLKMPAYVSKHMSK